MNIEVAPPCRHTPLFPLGEDRTTYRKLDSGGVRIEKALGREIVVVAADALRQLAEATICSARAICGSCARSSTIPRRARTTGSSPMI